MNDFSHWSERRLADSSDEQLVTRLRDAQRSGEVTAACDAYEHLCARHDRRVRGMLGAKFPAREVEDLAQEVFIAVYEGVAGDRPITSFRAWLNQLIRNRIADVWRGPEGRRIKATREAGDPDAPYAERGREADYTEVEALEVVDQALDALSDQHREIVERYVIADEDAAETARATGATEANIYQVARRFRVDLKRRLTANDNQD